MPEQPRHLANKYEDIVNLQGRGHIVAASRTACFQLQYLHWINEIYVKSNRSFETAQTNGTSKVMH